MSRRRWTERQGFALENPAEAHGGDKRSTTRHPFSEILDRIHAIEPGYEASQITGALEDHELEAFQLGLKPGQHFLFTCGVDLNKEDITFGYGMAMDRDKDVLSDHFDNPVAVTLGTCAVALFVNEEGRDETDFAVAPWEILMLLSREEVEFFLSQGLPRKFHEFMEAYRKFHALRLIESCKEVQAAVAVNPETPVLSTNRHARLVQRLFHAIYGEKEVAS